jgi:hypothetical protein
MLVGVQASPILLYYPYVMVKVRRILLPPKEGNNVTVAEARAALRELSREARNHPDKKASSQQKSAHKAG